MNLIELPRRIHSLSFCTLLLTHMLAYKGKFTFSLQSEEVATSKDTANGKIFILIQENTEKILRRVIL